ncbi:MAG: hypothetical protein K0R63_965 [Rickettsiales bacterium]|jgi:hypothetical protein|nr:hypothetical protein [Rickettsiales bacterium]
MSKFKREREEDNLFSEAIRPNKVRRKLNFDEVTGEENPSSDVTVSRKDCGSVEEVANEFSSLSINKDACPLSSVTEMEVDFCRNEDIQMKDASDVEEINDSFGLSSSRGTPAAPASDFINTLWTQKTQPAYKDNQKKGCYRA